MSEKIKEKYKFPHVFVILIAIILIAYIATLIVPSGMFERVEGPNGRMVVDPSSFNYTEIKALNPVIILNSIPNGMIGSALIMMTIFIIGGSWEIIHKTGTVTAVVSRIASKMKGHELLIFPLLMFSFAAIISLIGALELSIVFLPAIMPLMLAFGFDTMTAAGCVLIGGCAGFAASITNPFTVGIAQSIAGLPPYSGMSYRLAIGVTFFATGLLYVIHKAKKIRENPESSLVYQESLDFKEDLGHQEIEFNTSHLMISLSFLAGLGLILYGVLKLGWFMSEIGSVFLGIGILAMILGKLSPNDACEAFIKGAKSVITAALVVGFARAIVVVIESGQIIDTIVYGLTNLLGFLPKSLSVIGVFIFQSLFNFVVNSGSGQALITMPILAPMADILGVTRQTFVLTTIMGDGISNILWPTSGILMACVGYAKIPYQKWLRYIMPVIIMWSTLAMVFLVIAQLINYGPF